MTIEEFDKIKWHAGMKARYRGTTYLVSSVSLAEKLVALLYDETDEDELWVRCENCELVEEGGEA